MSAPTPAYAYGAFLGSFHRALTGFAQQLAAGFEAGKNPPASLSAADFELVAQLRYRRRLARERTIGLAFVHAEAQRVRRELGLSTTPPWAVSRCQVTHTGPPCPGPCGYAGGQVDRV